MLSFSQNIRISLYPCLLFPAQFFDFYFCFSPMFLLHWCILGEPSHSILVSLSWIKALSHSSSKAGFPLLESSYYHLLFLPISVGSLSCGIHKIPEDINSVNSTFHCFHIWMRNCLTLPRPVFIPYSQSCIALILSNWLHHTVFFCCFQMMSSQIMINFYWS